MSPGTQIWYKSFLMVPGQGAARSGAYDLAPATSSPSPSLSFLIRAAGTELLWKRESAGPDRPGFGRPEVAPSGALPPPRPPPWATRAPPPPRPGPLPPSRLGQPPGAETPTPPPREPANSPV